MRLIGLLLLALAAAVPAAARAAVPPALGPDARVFTLAGGGTEDPREGLPATRADLIGSVDVAALPDGALAFAELGELWRIGTDGLIHDIPDPGIFTEQIAARPDGTLLAVTETRVRSLAPGATRWDRGFPLRRIPFSTGELSGSDLAALPDGFAIIAYDHVYVVRGGTVRKTKLTGLFHDGRALAPLPDGRLAVAYDLDRRLGLIGLDGAFSSFRAGAAARADGLAALGDGTLLAMGETLRAVDTAGTELAVAGAAPGLGSGDGGPPATAVFDAGSVTAAPANPSEPVSSNATQPAGVAAPWPLAAIAPATYETIGEGRVAIATSFAGHAVLTVSRSGREVGRAEADVAAGDSELALTAAPRRGDLRLKLVVRAADGRVATARATATTLTRLAQARVRPLVSNLAKVFTLIDSVRLRRGGCVRQSPQQIACRLVRHGRCRRVATVLLRADGARIYAEGRRACRSLR